MVNRDVAALVVVDMQNDFLAQGGYYDVKTRLARVNDGELSPADIATLAQLYRSPPPSCVIRDGYQDFVTRVASVAAAALDHSVPTIFIRAAYNPAS